MLQGFQYQQLTDIDSGVLPMLADMERNGVYIDQPFLNTFGAELQCEIDKLRFQITPHAWPGFNANSADQVTALLFNKLCLKPGKKTKSRKRYKADDEELDRLKNDHPVVPLIQKFRGLSKLKGTFVDGILAACDVNSRCHTHLRHAQVISGRLSSGDPINLQNIPSTGLGKKVRLAFCAPVNRQLFVADLSQIELRILAHISQDPVMLEAYRNNEDLHAKTGHLVGGYALDAVPKDFRTACKRFNFGIAYGITDEGLLVQLAGEGINWSLEQVAKFRAEWFKAYPAVKSAMDAVWAFTRRHGYVVDIWGRPRWLPGIWSDIPKIRNEAERQAFNMVCQGGAAGVIKLIMARIWREMPEEWNDVALWLLQVHDELIAEIPEDQDFAEEFKEWTLHRFATTVQLSVPVLGSGSFGPNWLDAK